MELCGLGERRGFQPQLRGGQQALAAEGHGERRLGFTATKSDNKPELEIFADDVQCGHGATSGALDEDLLFYLRARGIGRNDRVALLANNSIEHLVCYFGVMAYGATICTVHVEMNRHQLDNIFARLRPKLVLFQDGLQLDDLILDVPPGTAIYDDDSGELDEPEYWRAIEATCQEHVPGLHLYDALRELGWDGRGRPVVLGLMSDVPSRYRQAVLTNDATKFLGEGWRDTWEYAGYFERIMLAAPTEEARRHPDRRALVAQRAAAAALLP